MKIAFCGVRHAHVFSLYHMASQNPDTQITGAWEEDDKAREKAEEIIKEKFYDSYEALLEDESVDAVAIGDYYGIRGERIIKALKAGKHVIADKPVCTDIGELREIERLSSEKGLTVSCLLDLRFDAAVRLARDIVRSDEIGEVHAINFTGQHPLDYGNRPMWYFEEGKHGGTFNDIAIHGIDAVKMITGLNTLTPLLARQWNAFAKAEKNFKDCAQLIGKDRHHVFPAVSASEILALQIIILPRWQICLGAVGMYDQNRACAYALSGVGKTFQIYAVLCLVSKKQLGDVRWLQP